MKKLTSLRKLTPIGQAAPSRQKPKLRKERRNNGRISIQELNEAGAGALRDKVKEVSKPEDRRPAWVKALDFIDVPRNIVGNIIGSIAGVDKSKLSSGTFGMKKVFTSDILRKLGVKDHVARGILGFVGDIATDPLTFYSLGAKTGMAISKALPKMLRGGTQPLRQAATTGRIAPRIAKALGLKAGTAARAAKRTANAAKIGKAAGKYSDLPLDLARGKRVQQFVGRSGEKLAETIKALRKAGKNAEADILVAATAKRAHKVMGKRGGLLTEHMAKVATRPLGKTKRAEEMMRGARQYIQKHAVKGRTVARLPFAEQGLTLKIGRQAENYRKILDPDVIKGLMNTGGVRDLIGKQARNVAKAKAAITAGQEMAAVKTLDKQGRKQAARAIRQGRKELAGATTKSEILKGRLQSMLTDPNAPGPIRALGEAEFGASTAPRAGAGRLERMGHAIKQAKQKTFGPGASPMHQREVSLNQQMSSGADAAGYQTGKAWQKAHQPTISKWAHKLNTTDDDAAARIVNLIETRMGQTVNKLHADDPAREAIRLARESGLADDPAVQKAVQDYQKVQAGVRSQRQAAKVGATELDDYFHRIADNKFRKSATAQKQRFPDKPYHEQRAKRVTIVDDAGNPVLDRTLLSSGPDAKRVAEFKKLGYKAVESDISQQQWNDWRKMGAKAHTPGSSLAELDYTGAQFSNDIAKSLATSVTRAERLKAAAGLRDLALETGAKVPDKLVRSVPAFAGLAQPTIPKNSPFYSTLGKQLEGYSFPQPVSDMLTRFFKTTNQPEQMSLVMKASDRLFGYWKGQQLMSPAYTARNIVQNLFGGLMAGANPIEVAKMSFDKRLREVARAVENGTELTGTITVHGRQIPVEAFVQSGKMYNMFSSGFTSQLMAQELVGKHPGFITKAGKAQAALQRGKVGVDKVFLAWHKVNNSIETNMRLATWMQFMNQGLTPRQSAMRTIMAMPDLSDISLWERKYAARLFPWYRWMRRNGSLQLMHYLPNTPAWFASQGKLRRALQDSLVEKPVREDLRPEWMQESLATQISGNEEDGQVWLLASWLPFQELGRLAAGTTDIGEAARMGLESMHPGLKFGAELAVGTDIFRRRPIEPLTIADMATKGYKAFAGKMGTPLDNLLAIRPIKESFRSAEQRGGAVPKIRRALLGGAIQQVSRQRGLGSEYKRLTELIKDLRARINYARQLGDKTEIETLQRQWVAAIKRMHELGLPGVAKSSQQMLETAGVQAGQPAFGDR